MGQGSSVDRRVVLRQFAVSGIGLAAASWPAIARPAGDPLVFGVFPYLPALRIGREFGPLAQALAGLCDRPVSLQTKSGFPAFRQRLLEGHYDVALLHPFLYADAREEQDYRPLGRLAEDLAAIVVAAHERPLERFADLRGEVLAVPPRLSAVAQLVQYELRRDGLDGEGGVQLAYHRTKAACLYAVANGTAAACALPGFALSQLDLLEPIRMTPKFSTATIPGILMVAHGRLGGGQVAALRRAVVGWGEDESSRRMLGALGWTRFVAVRPGEYDKTQLALLVER
jgi:ABC-type phosphate/phosphonate transport system substrate-binding protein